MSSGENCMNEQYIDFLAEELAREKLVIFVGAGVSRNSGLPSWQELVKVFAKKLGINKSCFSSEETLQIPQIFYDEFSKIKYYEILQEVFEGTYEPNSIHKTLKKMNISHIITTNYDELIEKELNESREYDVIGKEEELAYSKSTKMIIKMHGDMKYRNVVLKQEDYDNYEENFPLISTYVKSLFTTNTIMFIGYSLNDVNVKNIMKWISNILNEDFRKVYLVTFDEKENNDILTRKKQENDKLVNRISLSVVDNNYEESLNSFLEKIIDKYDEKIEEKNRKFLKELNFLDKENLEKLLKYKITLLPEYYDNGFIKEQELQIEYIEEDKLEEKLKDYKENLIKSKIKKINGKAINEIFKDKKEIEELQKEENKNDEILKSIITYDKEKFLQLVEENFNLKNKFLLIVGYSMFQKYDILEKILQEEIKYSYNKKDIYLELLSIIQVEKAKRNLDRNYFKIRKRFFKNKNKKLILEIEEKLKNIDNDLDEMKSNKNTVYLIGDTKLNQSRNFIKDLFIFLVYNGFPINSDYFIKIVGKYVEILFITYNNKFNSSLKGEINSLEKFDYFDLFLTILIDNKKLLALMNETKIKEINCENNTISLFITCLKNILLLLFNGNNSKVSFSFEQDCRNIFSNITMLLSKMKLDNTNIQNLFDILFLNKQTEITKITSPLYINSINYMLTILAKEQMSLNTDKIKKALEIIFYANDDYILNENSLKFLILNYEKRNLEKINDVNIFRILEKKINSSLKIKLLKIMNNSIQNKKIEEYKELLVKEFNYNIYIELVLNDLIKADSLLENKLIEKYEVLCNTNLYDIHAIVELEELNKQMLTLVFQDKITDYLREKLKKYENIYLKNFLEKNSYINIWNYCLFRNEYNFNEFQKEDLKFFSKLEIKELLEKGKEYQDFMKMISNYSKENNDYISEAYIEFLEEQLNPKGDQ